MQSIDSINKPAVAAASASGLVLRLALRFGVGVGLVCAAWMLGLQLTGNNAFGPKQMLAQLLVPLAVIGSQWLLRRQLAPARPGLGRALAVGGGTALLAALISAASVVGLAHGAGEPALARHRAEALEIVRLQHAETPKEKRNLPLQKQQIQNVTNLTVRDMAIGNFSLVLLFGLLLALPGGIYFRE
ncbi:MAG: DUF4199 family protein [Janthinobacterium lividum]